MLLTTPAAPPRFAALRSLTLWLALLICVGAAGRLRLRAGSNAVTVCV